MYYRVKWPFDQKWLRLTLEGIVKWITYGKKKKVVRFLTTVSAEA